MKLISINTCRTHLVNWNDKVISTSIFKTPVQGRVALRASGLEGDGPIDYALPGGLNKAVFVYPMEHYKYWRRELMDLSLSPGLFGENFSVEGLKESEVNIGDRFRIGTAEVQITQPRIPCFQLGVKFGRADIIKRFLESERTGFYLSVLREGEVAAGDEIEWIGRDRNNVTVADIVRLHAWDKYDVETMRRALAVGALPESWRKKFRRRLEKLDGEEFYAPAINQISV